MQLFGVVVGRHGCGGEVAAGRAFEDGGGDVVAEEAETGENDWQEGQCQDCKRYEDD